MDPNETEKKRQEREEQRYRDERGMFLPGNPGGPGRPRGKTLKEWVREQITELNEEERIQFLKGIPKDVIWRMAEGNPAQDNNNNHSGTIKVEISKEIADKLNVPPSDSSDSS